MTSVPTINVAIDVSIMIAYAETGAEASFQPLPTTPALQTMDENLLRNMRPYLEISHSAAIVVQERNIDQGEETESAHGEDVEKEGEEEVEEEAVPSPHAYTGKGKGKARVEDDVAPEVEVEVEVAAKEKKSPKLRFPARMWNETVVGGRVDVQEEEVLNPKGESLKRKRVYLDLDDGVEASNGEKAEEKEMQVEERGRRKRTKTLKASQNEEVSKEKTSGASRSRGNATTGSISSPASRTAAATAASSHSWEKVLSTARANPPSRSSTRSAGPLVLPTTRHSPSDPIRINLTPAAPSALALEIASRTVDLRSPSSTSSSTASSTPTTPPISPNEGPRAAFHRLFSHLPSFSDYGDRGDWRKLMTWTKDKGWYVRGENDVWVKPVWKKLGWNARDERLERLWEGCGRRLEAERGWTWDEREEEGRKRGVRRPVDKGLVIV